MSPFLTPQARGPRTLFLLHEQRFLYFVEPSYLELYLPMVESGLLGETMVYAYQRDIRFVREQVASRSGSSPSATDSADARFCALLEQKIIEFRPDLVVYALTWPNEAIAPQTLETLKSRYGFGLMSVIWDHDEQNPLLQDYDRGIIGVSDCTVVADSLTRASAIRAREGIYADFVNTHSVVFLPMVPPASIFVQRPAKRYDVTISGSSEGHRLAVYDHLVSQGFDVHRSGGMMPQDTLLPIAQYADDLASSRIVVNTQTQGSRIQVKGRVAQSLASGTFLLEQDNLESRAYLKDIDVVLWSTLEELSRLVTHYLAHAEEREAMALRAHAQWKATYNAKAFVERVLGTVHSSRQARTARHPFRVADALAFAPVDGSPLRTRGPSE